MKTKNQKTKINNPVSLLGLEKGINLIIICDCVIQGRIKNAECVAALTWPILLSSCYCRGKIFHGILEKEGFLLGDWIPCFWILSYELYFNNSGVWVWGGDGWWLLKGRLNLWVPNLGEILRSVVEGTFTSLLKKVICRYFSVEDSSSKRRKLLNVVNIFHVFCKLWTPDTQACSNTRTRLCRIQREKIRWDFKMDKYLY